MGGTVKKKDQVAISIASRADIPALVEMMLDSHTDTIFEQFGATDQNAVEEFFSKIMEHGRILLAKKGDRRLGALAIAHLPLFYCPTTHMAQTLFWWVDREHRGNGIGEKLMLAGEREARNMGAKFLVFTVRQDLQAAGRACIERGYRLAESQYYKEVT